MTIVSTPFAKQVFSPTAQSEQELAYEFLSEATWTDEAYLVLATNTTRFVELSEGRLVFLPIPTLEHQDIILNFAFMARLWFKQNPVGKVSIAAHPIRLWPGKYREPDAMIWKAEHFDRLGTKESGPPDLALEVLSPHNKPHDTETKLYEYAQAGIAEYWIVAPTTQRVSVYVLDGRSYRLVAHFGPGDQAHSLVLSGFVVTVSELFTK